MASVELTPAHGGDLINASQKYGIAISDWLDLSTGLNPDGYPIPCIPEHCYRRLPLPGDSSLVNAAKHYYGCEHSVAAAGSQRLIQLLPTLRSSCRVAIPDVGYQEHHHHWQRNGHSVTFYNAWQPQRLSKEIHAGNVDCVVLINPSNPTAVCVDTALLLQWQKSLAKRGGWLIIDEAFVDACIENSFATHSHLPGVIILRSLGKFFGLAGLRVGFALSEKSFCQRIAIELGPWAVTGPAHFIAAQALHNEQWQNNARVMLAANSQWMFDVVQQCFDHHSRAMSATALFINVILATSVAKSVQNGLAERGILVRYWSLPTVDNALLRFGLISESDGLARQRFQSALSEVFASSQVFSII